MVGEIAGKQYQHVSYHLCKVLMIFQMVMCLGGYLANSLAIATDAAHLLTDFASFMISLFSLWVATRPATKKMSFGWYRAGNSIKN